CTGARPCSTCCSSNSRPSIPTRRSSDLHQPARLGLLRDLAQLLVHLGAVRRAGVDGEADRRAPEAQGVADASGHGRKGILVLVQDRKSTRLNSSHVKISYAVFCLKKKHE